jgi:hypothetical protein
VRAVGGKGQWFGRAFPSALDFLGHVRRALSDDVVERGALLGVATPRNRATFDILSVHSEGSAR